MAAKRWLVGCIVLLLGTLATVTLALLVVNLSMEQDGLALGTFSKRVGLIGTGSTGGVEPPTV